jgi:CubicO group peptidase (beta-lactamase class C family)
MTEANSGADRIPIVARGRVAPEFEPVRDAFVDNFRLHDEVGAAVAVVRNGALVVDLWGGYTDAHRTTEWQHDTLVNVFSTTKGMVALCAHLLVAHGALEVDECVAYYWPEFAQGGKAEIPVRYLLDHRSGLVWLSPGPDGRRWFDWDACCARLARYEPSYPPGTLAVYQGVTFGFLVGEVIRRITGATVGQFFAREVAEPFQADFHIGLGPADHVRVAEIVERDRTAAAFGSRNLLLSMPSLANTPEWRCAEIPSMNGHGTARSIAQVYGVLADGGAVGDRRLVNADDVARMWQRSGITDCRGGPHDAAWALGFMPNWSNMFGPNDAAFGHTGFGGSFGMADPEAGLAIGYVMNRMGTDWSGDIRAANLIRAVYDCAAA